MQLSNDGVNEKIRERLTDKKIYKVCSKAGVQANLIGLGKDVIAY